MNILKAEVIGFRKITMEVDDFSKFSFPRFIIKNDDKIMKISYYSIKNNVVTFVLDEDVNIKTDCYIFYNENINAKCTYYKLFASDEFNGRYYTMDELGVQYTSSKSEFRVWTPAATSVNLLLYRNGDPLIEETPRKIIMNENNGLWCTYVYEDLKNSFYTYEVTVYENTNEAVDPYAKAVGINGIRGAIIDFNETNPIGFSDDISPSSITNYTDAIIYEISVRDMTSNPNSGASHKGKFLGLTEENTVTSKNEPTGISYIKDIGITHVQIMPMFDYAAASVDERSIDKYNWGYDPENYNVPEGCYSTDPFIPECRIIETKEMIQAFHKNGLCVNMDVVFNHLFHAKENCFEKIFPGYYIRHDQNGFVCNGSGCTNDTASENLMMQRYIVDSVLYWASEYHLDGFRFDLMGIHDIDTMNIIRNKLNNFGRTIMLYGEGWDLNTALPEDKKAKMSNASKTPHLGYFNDVIRDCLKGSFGNIYDKGYISGKENLENNIKACVAGCIKYGDLPHSIFSAPDQSINYVSCHDNNVLWDKLIITNGDESEEIRINRQKLALGIILTSQGIPFLHSGAEFIRTKQGVENSYNSPDEINWIDWDRKDSYSYITDYIKGIISLRRNHPAFRLTTSEAVLNHLQFLDNQNKNVVAFLIKNNANGDSWKNILVIYNANNYSVDVKLPSGSWNLAADKYIASNEKIINYFTNSYKIESLSINILYNESENL